MKVKLHWRNDLTITYYLREDGFALSSPNSLGNFSSLEEAARIRAKTMLNIYKWSICESCFIGDQVWLKFHDLSGRDPASVAVLSEATEEEIKQIKHKAAL